MRKSLCFPSIRTIISVTIIKMKKTILIFALCFALGPVGVQLAADQLAPPAAPTGAFPADVAHNTSRASRSGVSQNNGAVQPSDETKVVRIYGGGGHFDQVLAEKLRPNLAKVFAFAAVKSAALKPLPGPAVAAGTVPAVPNAEGQKKASSSGNL
jgi:predicted methyltransferase